MKIEIKNVKLCGWRRERGVQNIEWYLKNEDTSFYAEIPCIKVYDGQKYIIGDNNVVVYPLDVLDMEVNMYTDSCDHIFLVLTKITHVEHHHEKDIEDYNILEKTTEDVLFDINEMETAFDNVIEKCSNSDNYTLSRYKAKKIQETFKSIKTKLRENKEKIEECGIKYSK